MILGAAGNSPWIVLDRLAVAFAVALRAVLTSGAVLTYRVQHTQDSPSQAFRRVSIARTTTVATVTDIAHGLSVGDSVVVAATGSTNLDKADGADVASVVDADSYTYTVSNTGATADGGHAKVKSFRVAPHATMVDLTASADANYAFPVQACRLRVSAYTSGKVDLTVVQGLGV